MSEERVPYGRVDPRPMVEFVCLFCEGDRMHHFSAFGQDYVMHGMLCWICKGKGILKRLVSK